jgi:tetratricopeptide (TPR) repeat protein
VAQEDQTAEAPTLIAGRYRVQGLLGRGGAGAVHRVFDEREQRSVALKTVGSAQGSLTRTRLLEMFSREYRTLAQLDHPSVISVYEYGVTESGPYFTMELLEGIDLHAAAPLPYRDACAYLRDVSSCLSLLHSRRLLHRDVSPRNVRCAERHAKLLDFGAMTPMGPVRQVIGTPPLVPPEALRREPLDARCDLYALGATLYWALTRRHAYPARALEDLPAAWQQRPPPPSAIVPGIPEALDTLVMSLLALQVEARPRSAAEVMERLSSIGGLAFDEHLHVPMSYLSVPTLIGRETELAQVRARLEAAGEGSSQVLFVEGESGVGRSRMLDAAAVEARLLGATVLRLDAGEASRGRHGVLRALLRHAGDAVLRPEVAAATDELLARLDRQVGDDDETRLRLLSRARAVVRRLCARSVVVIAFDDVDLVDEASQEILAALPRVARKRLVLLLSGRSSKGCSSALATRLQANDPIRLSPLDAGQTEALLRSVFGDVPNASVVAARVHAVSRGNSRATMELAEHLLATGKARYELGGWVLPQTLEHGDLPEAWSAALDARLLSLDPDQRELAEVLAFARAYGLPAAEIDHLTAHGSAERSAAALDGLLAAGLVRLDGEHLLFPSIAHRERVTVLADAARVRDVHARLARRLTELGRDPIDVARCQLLAERADAAIDGLLAMLQQGTRWETAPADYASVLEQAVDACLGLQRPPRDRFRLLNELTRVGEHLGVGGMRARFAELFAQLHRDSGLDLYASLPDTLDPMQRLTEALTAAQARFDATPERERVLSPIEGVTAIAMTTRQAAAFAAASMDSELLRSLPNLAPFTPLSDALRSTVEYTLPASLHLTAGRYEEARRCYGATLERLSQPDRAGLDEAFWQWATHALYFALGQIAAGLGLDEALDYAARLELTASWAPAAWDVRGAYYRRQGDWRQARTCSERMERLRLETGRRPPMVDTSARLHLDTSAHAGDLTSAREAYERMQELIANHPGYAPYSHYGPAVIELLRGNYALALEHCERALALAPPGEHPTWPWIASCKLETLLAQGRYAEAREAGERYLEQARAIGLGVMADHVEVPLALAEARLGEHARAAARLDAVILARQALGSRGLNLGWAYEQRARVAVWMNDREAFVRAAEGCGREYGKGRGTAAFAGRYEALCAESRQAGMGSPSLLPPQKLAAGAESTAFSTRGPATTGTEAWLDMCYAEALATLVRESGAEDGVLFRASGRGALVRCAATAVEDPDADLHSVAASAFSSSGEHDPDEDATAAITASDADVRNVRWLPIAVGAQRDGRFERSGVAVLRFARDPRALSSGLIEQVDRLLRATLAS